MEYKKYILDYLAPAHVSLSDMLRSLCATTACGHTEAAVATNEPFFKRVVLILERYLSLSAVRNCNTVLVASSLCNREWAKVKVVKKVPSKVLLWSPLSVSFFDLNGWVITDILCKRAQHHVTDYFLCSFICLPVFLGVCICVFVLINVCLCKLFCFCVCLCVSVYLCVSLWLFVACTGSMCACHQRNSPYWPRHCLWKQDHESKLGEAQQWYSAFTEARRLQPNTALYKQ